VAINSLLPVLIVLAAAAVVLVLDVLPPRDSKSHLGGVALAGIIGALLSIVVRWGSEVRAFRDMILLDNYAMFFDLIICYAAALIVIVRTLALFELTFLTSGADSTTLVVALYYAAFAPGIRPSQQIDAMAVVYMATSLAMLLVALRFVNPTNMVVRVRR